MRRALKPAVRRLPSDLWLWLWWMAVTLAAACAVQTRLPWYILPALVPTALIAAAIPAFALRRGAMRTIPGVLALIAIALIALHAPRRWRTINHAAQRQRALSMPSYMLAMKARAANRSDPGGELFFAGIPLPTLVYYSGMRVNFVETSELAHVELVGADVPDAISSHDLVLLDPSGRAIVVGSLDREWHWIADAASFPSDFTAELAKPD